MTDAQDRANRWPITISIMLATVMNSLDSTIANVALPHIQGSVQASQDQITWVLTSYIVASAIMIPMTGWLADRIGRKRLFLISIGGFTVASMLCGAATSLPEIVGFRLLQGLFGAALIPLSQAVLLDINPPEKHGQAMAIWGAGAILGPILGPALGGWLTQQASWRWVFLINLPVGILAFLGVLIFISADRETKAKPFDFLGFFSLTCFIGGLQLILDRGPGVDWFSSPEIWTYLVVILCSVWVFIAHTLTAKNPFFDPALAADRNFVSASVFGFFIGILLFSTMALLPPMMQGLMGYPVLTSGLVSMPRGVGSFIAMFAVGQLVGRVDTRLILITGLSISCVSLTQMIHFDLSMGPTPFMISGFIQGLGIGLLFVPLSTLAFATIPPHLRPEGSSLYTLIRNMGSAVGISIMQALVVANTQTMHGSLAAHINPSDPVVRADLAGRFDLSSVTGLQALNTEVTRQATMIAYIDDFKLMLIITIACMPMLLLMRPAKRQPGGHVAIEVD
ncbi:DHA2 family efflux MFS transporter permease subunit [Phenylobacterium aquaticum]|uniref:DHA2 family efflux MFS transporter permease subunit n=1 Tax=Phenylobacterium aquaticum TaxID=1763816 RepID=UPI001F5C1AB3|nr:DHA2 family efflux MFS transporter permease subunit [Phenylobacterium aquaticum]MCI3134806.1 DHA2 family efflux MFS transporter permease subunit [Phenylobacterium aquaticum]